MKKQSAEELLKKYHDGNCSPDEIAAIESWHIRELLGKEFVMAENDLDDVKTRILKQVQASAGIPKTRSNVRNLLKYAAAAAVVVFVGMLLNLYIKHDQPVKPAYAVIKPGTDKAILTLGDGREIVLGNSGSKQLATQGSVAILQKQAGLLVYSSAAGKGDHQPESLLYNTVSTPRGGKFRLVLPDGTNVWLNAQSAIRFPAAFGATERKVEITGEAYFEVAKNKAKPFRVISSGQTVEVLGTHFNINSYRDEGTVKTTLLEGSIRLTTASAMNLLKPNDQATVGADNQVKIEKVDAEDLIVWKEGYFKFNRTRLKTVFSELSRWYDIDVECTEDVSNDLFTGKIEKDLELGQILELLDYIKVDFKVEGRKIIVNKH